MFDFTQENDLWQSIQTAANSAMQRQQTIEFIRLLVEKIAVDSTTLATWDKDDLTDVLLEYQVAGQGIATFLQTALPHLDADYQGEAFEQELQTLQQRLAAFAQSTQQFKREEKRLNKDKKQLTQALQNQQKQAEKLRTLTTQVTRLKQQLDKLAEQSSQPSSISEQAQQQAMQTVLEAIPRIVDLVKVNRNLMQMHFETNRDIAKAMQSEVNLMTAAAGKHTQHIVTLKSEIEQQLAQFDQALQALITLDEDHRRALRQLREANTHTV